MLTCACVCKFTFVAYIYRVILHFIMLHCTTVLRWFNCCWRMELTQTHLQMYAAPCIHALLVFKVAILIISQNGFFPLISAAKIGSKEILQLLLRWSSSDGERIDVSKAGNVSLVHQCMHITSLIFCTKYLAMTLKTQCFCKH